MKKPLTKDVEWTFPLLEDYYYEIAKIAKEQFGIEVGTNQIEVITAEQMISAYTSHAMPLYYEHWTMGLNYMYQMNEYKSGKSGLAYEVVINSSPVIAYLMEDNTMAQQILVMAHACHDGETEYLSPTGWKKLSEYNGGRVGQYTKDGYMEFVHPSKYIVNPCEKMFEFENSNIHQRLTGDHRVVYKSHVSDNLKVKTFNEVKEQHERKTRGFQGRFLTTFKTSIDTELFLTDDELRLQIAIIADGSIVSNKAKFHLKKERKILRLYSLLKALNREYNTRKEKDGTVLISFYHNGLIDKEFDEKYYRASAKQLSIISNEVLLWDGSTTQNRNMFCSTSKASADFVQYAFSADGFRAPLKCYIDKRHNKKPLYVVARVNEKTTSISGGRSAPAEIKEFVPLDKKSYCFTVPSGMFIARSKGKVFVTGNCFGHHWINMNNYLFREWTNPDEILRFLGYAKKFIAQQEELWGIDEVEDVIDACHCLNKYVDRYKKPVKLSKKKQKQYDTKRRIDDELNYNSIWDTIPSEPKTEEVNNFQFPDHPEENILKFIEQHAPNIPNWKREIINIIRNLGQYFYPQMFTQVLNEGFACFTHYHICYALFDKGLIDEGFMLELLELHTSVIAQGDFHEINPYKLGFKLLMDIKRISIDPTEEDKDWFRDQDWVGNGKWMENVKYAVSNFKDESIILQYLSPKLMRDFSMFSLMDDSRDDMLEVTDIHDMEGYKHIRETLSNMYRLNSLQPDIKVTNVNVWGDRRLTLTHYRSDRHLDEEHTLETMKAIQLLWDYDVELITEDRIYSVDGKTIKETP